MTQTIFITTATGQQGSATIKALLTLPQLPTIHALVRDPSAPAAQFLTKHSNIKVFQGNFDDLASITAAATSCTAAFLNVTPVFTDPAGEARHARNLVTACIASPTIKRVIFSSSGAMRQTSETAPKLWNEWIPKNPNAWMTIYMTSKQACEEAITSMDPSSLPEGWAVIRGTTFLSNYLAPATAFMYPTLATEQTITTALKPDYHVNTLDSADLGKFAAKLLTLPATTFEAKYKGQFISFAKERLTLSQIIDKMNTALRKKGVAKQIKVVHLNEDEAKERAAKGDMIVGSELFQNEFHHSFDPDEEVRKWGVDVDGMVSADEFFEKEVGRIVQAVGGA